MMGSVKYQTRVQELFEKSPVVSFDSIRRIVRNKKNVKEYSKQLVRNLILKGKVKRLVKGHYSVYDDSTLNVFCFRNSYLGLQDALSFHGVWEQETIPVIVSAGKIRQGLRKTDLGNIFLRRIDKKYFFGIEYKKSGDFYFPYSDLEKSFIDMIYFKEFINEDVLKNIKKKIDVRKLKRYLKKYPLRFRNKVLEIFNNF